MFYKKIIFYTLLITLYQSKAQEKNCAATIPIESNESWNLKLAVELISSPEFSYQIPGLGSIEIDGMLELETGKPYCIKPNRIKLRLLNQSPVNFFKENDCAYTSFASNQAKTIFAAGDENGKITLYDLKQLQKTLKNVSEHAITALGFNYSTLYIHDENDTTTIWDTSLPKPQIHILHHPLIMNIKKNLTKSNYQTIICSFEPAQYLGPAIPAILKQKKLSEFDHAVIKHYLAAFNQEITNIESQKKYILQSTCNKQLQHILLESLTTKERKEKTDFFTPMLTKIATYFK